MYSLFIYLYKIGVKFSSLFYTKAALMNNGHKDLLNNIDKTLTKIRSSKKKDAKTYLIHCASLGEFEQGRTLLEKLRAKDPESIIVLTFFSPSGYEPNKDYKMADAVFYLPYDSKSEADKFAKILKADTAIIVKYEYWRNIFHALYNQGTSIYIISALFQSDMCFFNILYGSFFRYPLKFVSHFFVQDSGSKALLNKIGFDNVTIAGDTRYDRVTKIPQIEPAERINILEKFIDPDRKRFIAGSVWPSDMKRLIPFMLSHPEIQFIIAPHNIIPSQIDRWMSVLSAKLNVAKFTEIEKKTDYIKYDVIFVDCVGILSQVYKFASLTFVGGAYDRLGVHNVLEPAVWYKPVLFGPVISRFIEAVELVNRKGGYIVRTTKEIEEYWQKFLKEGEIHSKLAGDFVFENVGGTDKIIDYITK